MSSVRTPENRVQSSAEPEPKLTRRALMQTSLAALFSLAAAGNAQTSRSRAFEPVTSRLQIFRDAVNVGVIQRNRRVLLVGSGEEMILESVKQMGAESIDWVLYTDHHRDQCSGAGKLKKAGAKIAVPAAEAQFFRDATDLWQDSDKALYHRYHFRPDWFIPRESIQPDRELRPDEVLAWEGLEFRVISTPGTTDGSVTYLVDLDGERIAFTGDLIYKPGQIWNMYRLQKRYRGMTAGDYWGFGGAVIDVLNSLDKVLSYNPSLLVPMHGTVMKHPRQAVSLLRDRVNAAMKNYFVTCSWRIYHHHETSRFEYDVQPPYNVPMLKPLPPVQRPPWLHRSINTSSYLRAEDGKIFLFDCGFKPIAHKLERLKTSGAISGIDGIWLSHYHDDHVSSVNIVRRRLGGEVYAQKEMRDILENPTAYSMPCLFPESIRVDHALSEGEVIHWKGYKMTAYYFPGQTLYHDGLLIEHDGTRVFMTGDSFANWGIDDYCSYNRNFLGDDGETAGYLRCVRLLLKLKPDFLMAAHWGPEPVSEEYLRKTLALLEERGRLLTPLFPWDDPNFGLDPSWVQAYPYHQVIRPRQLVTIEAKIFNHSSTPRRASAELRLPDDWRSRGPGSLIVRPHTEGSIRLEAIAPAKPQRQREVLGLSVRFGTVNLGEVSEAIVDYSS